MKHLALCALFVLAAVPAHAQSRFVDIAWKGSAVFALAAHGADLAGTEHCLGAGLCRETNPWLGHLSSDPEKFGAVKIGGAALSIWLTSKAPKPVGIVINLGVGVAMSLVARHNAEQIGPRR